MHTAKGEKEVLNKDEFFHLPIYPTEKCWERKSQEKWNQIAKPLYSLGKFEPCLNKIAAIKKTTEFSLSKRAILVMCADNGIVEEGVTQTDSEVTRIVAENMAKGISSVCKMAQVTNTQVIPVDIGMFHPVSHEGMRQWAVAAGTKNFLTSPAMTEEQMLAAIERGIRLVKQCKEEGCDILGTGEMGIGNTTTSTAVICGVLGLSPEKITGRGAGLSDEGLQRKITVIKTALEKYDDDFENVESTKNIRNPENQENIQNAGKKLGDKKISPEKAAKILQCVGGLDIAGLTGVFLGGAIYGVPVVLDGIITAAAALIAACLYPETKMYMLASHCSKEPSMKMVMDFLELEPVLYADMALGEGTGCAMMFGALDMVHSIYRQNVTFSDIAVDAYEDFTAQECE